MGYYNISNEEFEEITEGDSYKAVTPEVVESKRRWVTLYSQVFQNKEDGTFWEVSWQQGNTEYQDCDLDASKVQVKPVEVKTIKYVIAEKD